MKIIKRCGTFIRLFVWKVEMKIRVNFEQRQSFRNVLFILILNYFKVLKVCFNSKEKEQKNYKPF